MAFLFDPLYQAMDANGLPLSGATLTFYRAGTSSKINTYQNSQATTPHTNPVVADSAGKFPPIFHTTASAYKFILKNASGVTVQTVDRIPVGEIVDLEALGQAVDDAITYRDQTQGIADQAATDIADDSAAALAAIASDLGAAQTDIEAFRIAALADVDAAGVSAVADVDASGVAALSDLESSRVAALADVDVLVDQAEAARDLAEGYVNDAVSANNVPIFDSRDSAAIFDLTAFKQVEIQRFTASSPVSPVTYEKVAQPGNVEPSHDAKFQDSAGHWFELKDMFATIAALGALGDGSTDDRAAMLRAATYCNVTKRALFAFPGDYACSDVVALLSDTQIIGIGAREEIIFRSTFTGTNANLFTGTNVERVNLHNLTLDGGLSATHTLGHAVRFVTSLHCEVTSCYVKNSPRESILFRDGSNFCKANDNRFDRQGGGAGHIYGLTDCLHLEAQRNHFTDSAGGCIWLSGGCHFAKFIGNSCDQSDYELIGVRWDCNFGFASGNKPKGCGDNGISITGSGWIIEAVTGTENDFAAVALYGSFNTLTGSVIFDNGKAGGSLHAAVLIAAQFGGLAAYNVVNGCQIFVKDGATTEQFYGVRISSTSYDAWASGVAVTTGDYRTHLNRLYVPMFAGTTGATPPTHGSGDVSDGAVTWRYIGTFENTLSRPHGNRIGPNKIGPHAGGRIQRFGASPQDFDEQDETSKQMRVKNAWATATAYAAGDLVTHLHSDDVKRYYRATTSGTSGATAPTHTSSSASDGGVTWYYLGQGDLHDIMTLTEKSAHIKGKILLENIDTTGNPPSITASTGSPESVISAPNGSLHIRVNTTAPGLFLKTGTSNANTGWLALATSPGSGATTAANIASAAHAVNTTYKVQGRMVYDTTNNRIMVASGSSATSAWYVADGSASVTPA